MLLGRTTVQQLIVAGGTVFLARLLSPEDFGVFGIAKFALLFFAFFGDAGLGAALIQKREHPTQRELSTIFFVQIGLAVAMVAVVGIGAESVRWVWTDLPEGSEWLFRALSVGLLLTVLRVNPALLMERELQFGRLAVLETLQSFGFYGTAVFLASHGFAVWSLVAGALVQGVVGAAGALFLRPWRPTLVFDREVLRPIVGFGIPFQMKNIVGFVNGAITPFYAGIQLGAASVGFINWAQSTAHFPLRLVEVMGRVAFPLYSRLQDEPKTLAETFGRSVYVCAVGTFLMVSLFFGLGEPIIRIVFTDKWLPALPLLYIFAANISVGFFAPVCAAALDAMGRPQIFARLSVGWTILNWIVVPITTWKWELLGFAFGYSVHIVAGNLLVLAILVRLIPGVRLLRRLVPPAIAGVASGFTAWGLGAWATWWLALGGVIAACVVTYFLVLAVIDLAGIRQALALVPSRQQPVPADS